MALAKEFDDPVEEAKEAADRIEALCDEDNEEIPQWAKDSKPEFFEEIRDKAREIIATVKRKGYVTDKQLQALKNMRDGAERWIR